MVRSKGSIYGHQTGRHDEAQSITVLTIDTTNNIRFQDHCTGLNVDLSQCRKHVSDVRSD